MALISMEIFIVLGLILLNGLFAMAEIAIISSRKSRLQELAGKGNTNAQAALELAKFPNRFLSTVQVGITFIGIFAGAFGGERIARDLAKILTELPSIGSSLALYAEGISLFIVVAIITYASLIIGELVPKRLALAYPDSIAKAIARPMQLLSQVASPFVSLLTFSTDTILRLLQIQQKDEPTVSEEEVKMMIREGARAGVFNLSEKNIVERTFRLGDKKVSKLMTPITEVVWLDISNSLEKLRELIAEHPHSHFPVCQGSLDTILGVVRTKDLLTNFLVDEAIDLRDSLQKPLYIPENTEALKVLEQFKQSGIHMALIVDEYGVVQGVLSLTDILEEIVGEISTLDEVEEEAIMKRSETSWFVDGLTSLEEFKEYFRIAKLPGEKTGDFHTVGGFVMSKLDRVPVSGDVFEWSKFRFEVVDMDGNRVDKILLSKTQTKDPGNC